MFIVKERMVFWTVLENEILILEGKKYEARYILVCAAIVPDKENVYNSSEWNVFINIKRIANWLIPKDNPALLL